MNVQVYTGATQLESRFAEKDKGLLLHTK